MLLKNWYHVLIIYIKFIIYLIIFRTIYLWFVIPNCSKSPILIKKIYRGTIVLR